MQCKQPHSITSGKWSHSRSLSPTVSLFRRISQGTRHVKRQRSEKSEEVLCKDLMTTEGINPCLNPGLPPEALGLTGCRYQASCALSGSDAASKRLPPTQDGLNQPALGELAGSCDDMAAFSETHAKLTINIPYSSPSATRSLGSSTTSTSSQAPSVLFSGMQGWQQNQTLETPASSFIDTPQSSVSLHGTYASFTNHAFAENSQSIGQDYSFVPDMNSTICPWDVHLMTPYAMSEHSSPSSQPHGHGDFHTTPSHQFAVNDASFAQWQVSTPGRSYEQSKLLHIQPKPGNSVGSSPMDQMIPSSSSRRSQSDRGIVTSEVPDPVSP